APCEVGNGLVPHAPSEFVEESRLPDPGLADDAHDLAMSSQGQGQPALEELEVLPAPDERGHAPSNLEPRPFGPHEPKRGTSPASASERNKVEAPLEQRRRGFTDEDRVRLRVAHERLEHAPRPVFRLEVDLGAPSRLAHEALRHVDRDLQPRPTSPDPLKPSAGPDGEVRSAAHPRAQARTSRSDTAESPAGCPAMRRHARCSTWPGVALEGGARARFLQALP